VVVLEIVNNAINVLLVLVPTSPCIAGPMVPVPIAVVTVTTKQLTIKTTLLLKTRWEVALFTVKISDGVG